MGAELNQKAATPSSNEGVQEIAQAAIAARYLAAIVESSDDAIIFKDLNGMIQTWNKGAERIFGYTTEETIGKPVTILIPENHLEEEPDILARLRRGERVDHYETIRRRKDGRLINVSLTVSPVRDGQGRIIGASKIARDITERRHNVEVIRQQASLFDQAYDAMLVWQWNGPITYWNRGAERMYGFSRDEAIGKVSHKTLNTQTQGGIGVVLAGLERDGIWEGELRHTTRDGREIAVESRMVLIRDSGQSYVLEANRDISERKMAEWKLAESFEGEKAAREIAEAAVRAKDGFLAILSHELRTPLNPVLLIASDSAENPELPAEIRSQFETILKNVEVEVQLIDDLLDLTRMNHGKLNLHIKRVDAHVVLREAIQTVQAQMDSKGIHVKIHLKAGQHFISGDSTRLQQIFWNILRNAVKFTPEGGTITLETTSHLEAGKLEVKIADTGIGMTPGELKRVFAAFAQGDHISEKSPQYGGLGLGLTITKKLVELHSGKVEAKSEGRNKGTLFIIELPLPVS